MKAIGKALLALFFMYFIMTVIDSCQTRQNLKEAEKAYLTLKEQVKVEQEASEALVEGYEDRIAELNGMIDSINFENDKRMQKIEEGDERIRELREEVETLSDKDEIIANLESQLETRDYQLSLARETIKEQDIVIFSLTEKYNTQVKITDEYKAQLASATRLQAETEGALKSVSVELYREQKKNRVLNVGLAAVVGGAILYSLVK